MLMGSYNHTIDDKGRVIMPAKFREELGDSVVITRGLDRCLYVYTKEGWEVFCDKLNSLPLTEARTRNLRLFLLSGANPCDLDKQGRIIVPQSLRDDYLTEKEITLVGNGEHIEMWTTTDWKERLTGITDDMENLLEDLTELGFSF